MRRWSMSVTSLPSTESNMRYQLWALSRSGFGHSMGPIGFSLNELTKLQFFSHP